MGEISRFILFIGPVSSIFDYTTFFVMLYLFHCWAPSGAALFHTGWFVESLMTQTLIIHVIRTRQIPFLQARASTALTLTTIVIMAVGGMAAVFAAGADAAIRAAAGAVLANIIFDAALLRGI